MNNQVSPQLVQEFEKEVKILQKLQHDRLVSIVGVVVSPKELCMVLEYMPRGNLYNLIHVEKLPLDRDRKFRVARQIVEGLEFLHHGNAKPTVHRDLKSMNVVLDNYFNAKLCDFGLTQSMEKTHITRKEQESGSPRFFFFLAFELLYGLAALAET